MTRLPGATLSTTAEPGRRPSSTMIATYSLRRPEECPPSMSHSGPASWTAPARQWRPITPPYGTVLAAAQHGAGGGTGCGRVACVGVGEVWWTSGRGRPVPAERADTGGTASAAATATASTLAPTRIWCRR